jgi:hypothetical protein
MMEGASAIPCLPSRPHPVGALLGAFAPATPELLERRSLLTRVDSKFVVPVAQLEHILAGLADEYAVLRVDTGSLALYESLYFDTSTLRCFHDHRRGRRLRHKVRIRHYPDRAVSFLEVKSKRHEAMTDKRRLPVPYGSQRLGPAELQFLRDRLGPLADDLRPEISISYRRIGLISLASSERVTIDLGLAAGGDDGVVVTRALGHLAVIEVKQWPFSVRTPIMRAVRGAGHRVMSMSKYVTALALMRPELGCHRLLPMLRALERI